jgi:methionyl-tRNA formyltransferase
MRVCVIGRSEILYDAMLYLLQKDVDLVGIVTAKETVEYTKTAEDFKILARQKNIPFIRTLNQTKIKSFLELIEADIGISFNYTSVIPKVIIDTLPLGILNGHGGDLPRYRGNACQAWAIINGEDRIGLCVHKMIGGELDSGDIIERAYLEINEHTKIVETWEWMLKTLPKLFYSSILRLQADPAYILEKQTDTCKNPLRCFPRNPADGRIKWGDSALNIMRLVNASGQPYQGAYTYYLSKRVYIMDVQVVEYDYEICALPGQITQIEDNFFDICCGKGVLRCFCVKKNNTLIYDFRKNFKLSFRERMQ